ncbi:hypothetical protein J6O48_11170 [bacterium]|nr:hypothetical protein [bacterium]
MNITPINTIQNNSVLQNKKNLSGAPAFQGAPKVNKSTLGAAGSLWSGVKEGLDKGWDNFIENGVIKYGLKPVMNSKFMNWFADKTANVGNMPSHMATAGSIVTTYFYANRTKKTLNKDEEQKKRAKTLVLNQWMVTAVSTAGAYGINGALGKISKNLGYKFREANQDCPKLAKRMKGFDIAKQLLIFTVMYRYIAPVIVTPVASKISKLVANRKNNQQAQPDINNAVQVPMTPKAIKSTQFKSLNSFAKSA